MDYNIKTEQFEGPFGLLLELIETQELSITDISLSQVAEQFLEYVSREEIIKAGELADFLLVASRLLYIKSKVLLPDVSIEEEASMESLACQLRMYKVFADASKYIENRVEAPIGSFFGSIKGPSIPIRFVEPKNVTRKILAKSMASILDNLKDLLALPTVTVERAVSINEKIESIKETLTSHIQMSFDQLIAGGGRLDTIVSFLAVLELVKSKSISVDQNVALEGMVITSNSKS